MRMVHENILLHPVSVSDLGFIKQPQAASQGDTGAGTTIAVIDGGLGNNYTMYSDFWNLHRCQYSGQFLPRRVQPGRLSGRIDRNAARNQCLRDRARSRAGCEAGDVRYLQRFLRVIRRCAERNEHRDFGPSDVQYRRDQFELGRWHEQFVAVHEQPICLGVNSAGNAGITTVAAAGNSGSKSGLGNPACTPEWSRWARSTMPRMERWAGSLQRTPTGSARLERGGSRHLFLAERRPISPMLAPGTFVNAPNSSFQESGTSQATPHFPAQWPVLRARYPAEAVSETLQRLQLSDVRDTDSANGLTTPRLDLLAAVNQGTAVSLSGSGPTQAVSGNSATYTIRSPTVVRSPRPMSW